MANAKAGSTWLKWLVSSKSKPVCASTRVRYRPKIAAAYRPIALNATSATGNKYSTTFHRPGTASAPMMKATFTLIA